MNWQFRPIVNWPRAMTRNRKRAMFSSTFHQTEVLLQYELFAVRARAQSVVIQLAVGEAEIRRDGLPYANAKPAHPGVILTFEKPDPTRPGQYLPLSFPCDQYLVWTDNLRAIALSLEALRKVDRYGVTARAEQYRGWAALPGPIVVSRKIETVSEAAMFIRDIVAPGDHGVAVNIARSEDTFKGCYRQAVLKLHPDSNGGREHPQWHSLQDAREVLEKHHQNRSAK